MSWYELFGFGEKGWGGLLVVGLLLTIAVTLTALLIGAVFGSLAAWGKLSASMPARIAGDVYTTVFRGVPELLVIFLIYFGGSSLTTAIGHLFGRDGFVGLPNFLAGALAVGVISGAYQAEVFRAAFVAVSRGELEAARAVGMPRLMRFRRIIVPQVLRFAIPGLGNVWQLSLKDSALISITGLVELMRSAQIGAGSTRQYFGFYIAAGALYLLLTSVSNRVFETAEARTARSFRRRLA
ncbi:ABC transporter permease subunit [Lichenihabitans sp. Uapishka_5]|uniref:ABC transporter permease n=1 Tax=Lichenihabitans sp. Uapishka_5 TaxID=3037302 RepID=UPI0029E7CFCB|nr:ABC transporter permease subunit [Lichenihabitans sp. Uapishka_5]MDX7952702.1 ABC transporter permease subunit [Lichenihabitans sp. Uapishka_5]